MLPVMIVGTISFLFASSYFPEIIVKIEDMIPQIKFWIHFHNPRRPFPEITWEQYKMVSLLQLDDVWFISEPVPEKKRNIWRQRNAKCSWAPEPPMNRVAA